jgi:hypothetical protein
MNVNTTGVYALDVYAASASRAAVSLSAAMFFLARRDFLDRRLHRVVDDERRLEVADDRVAPVGVPDPLPPGRVVPVLGVRLLPPQI